MLLHLHNCIPEQRANKTIRPKQKSEGKIIKLKYVNNEVISKILNCSTTYLYDRQLKGQAIDKLLVLFVLFLSILKMQNL